MRLFLPEGTTRGVRERILGLSPATRVEIYELGGPESRMQKMDPCDAGNLESWLTTRGEIEAVMGAARDAFARIRALAPHASEVARDLTARVVPRTRDVAFGFRGLEFAWFSAEGISFGTGDSRHRLTAATEPALERLLHQLDLHRSPLAEDTNHILYRAAPERWLETLIQEDSSRLDAQLDPAHLYSQVPALAAGDRGVLDLLGVTRRGRLVVIELKASEDIQLPIQAVDYWLRVRRHQREGDFARYGYFAGGELDPAPPLVWLVAPGLRFHSASDVVLKYLSPEIHVTRIGLNENWRRGVQVIFRQ